MTAFDGLENVNINKNQTKVMQLLLEAENYPSYKTLAISNHDCNVIMRIPDFANGRFTAPHKFFCTFYCFVSSYKGKGIPWVCGNWQCLFWDTLQTVYPGGVFWFKAEVNKKWWKMLAKSWPDSLCSFSNLNKTFLLLKYLLCSSLPSL